MPILGTGVSDPDFYERKLALARQSLASISQGFRQRAAEKEARELQEIEMFQRAVATTPELVNTWGAQLKKKYGDKYGIGPTVDALSGRQSIRDQVESAGHEFYSAWDRLANNYDIKKGQINSQPDFVPTLAGIVPNMGKAQEMDELARIDPNRMAQMAAAQLPPSRRAAALSWAKQNFDQEIPDPATVDMFKVLPQDQQAFYALDMFPGMDPGNEIRDSLLYKTELKQSPQKSQEQEFTAEENRKNRLGQRGKVYLSDRLAREREEISNTHSLNRIGANEQAQKNVVQYRRQLFPPRAPGSGSGGGRSDSGISHKNIISDNNREIADWQAGLRNIGGQGDDREQAAKNRTEYENSHPRPRRLTDSEARALSTIINGASDSGLDPNIVAESVISTYQRSRNQGRTGVQALQDAKESLSNVSVSEDGGSGPEEEFVDEEGLDDGQGGSLPGVNPMAYSEGGKPKDSTVRSSVRPALKTSNLVENQFRGVVQQKPGIDVDATVRAMMAAFQQKVQSGMLPARAIQSVLAGE